MPEPGSGQAWPSSSLCPVASEGPGPSSSPPHAPLLFTPCSPFPSSFFSLPPSPILLGITMASQQSRNPVRYSPTSPRQSAPKLLLHSARCSPARPPAQAGGSSRCAGGQEPGVWCPSVHWTPAYPFCDHEHVPSPLSASVFPPVQWGGFFLGLTRPLPNPFLTFGSPPCTSDSALRPPGSSREARVPSSAAPVRHLLPCRLYHRGHQGLPRG